MSLPQSNSAWPPHDLQCVYEKLAIWSAWYSGDPDELSGVYGGSTAYDPTGFFATERGGFRGRVSRALQRFWWGERISPGERRTKLHIPVAGDIASVSADLLFSEPPAFTADNETTNKRLTELIDDHTHAALREAAEIAAALGGVFLRVVWNADMADKPWICAEHPDAAVPEFEWGRLSAVTFWSVVHDDGTSIVRHLQRYEPGRILHGVYVGDRDDLGIAVPLTEYPQTAPLASMVDAEGAIQTGIRGLAVVYVPNVRPNRLWRDRPAAAQLGRSDFAQLEGLMDNLDEAWSDWMRDLRLAKARLLVPQTMLDSHGRGQGASFDLDRELFTGLEGMLQKAGESPITQVQFKIRTDEHKMLTQSLLEQIVRGAGYSMQSFGMNGDTAVTATEVSARERQSITTRGRKINYWKPALAEIIEALLGIDQVVFKSGVKPQKPDVEFPDAVAEDPKDLAMTLKMLADARAASTETLVEMLHPDWNDTQQREEVALIRANPAPAPAPFQQPPGGPQPPQQQPGDPNVQPDPNAPPQAA
ncbi:phage portal protein [Streptomyces mirabilis]|uniref:phage portal protein n=1 Tax=Streptomyces mirabilis TaxID=68239 RepID=UPI0036B7C753